MVTKRNTKHLKLVFERFLDYGVVLHPSKCELGKPSQEFLGHIVEKDGIRPLDSKIAAVRDFPHPSTPRQLRKFVGMINFYHRFVPGIATILDPIYTLLSCTRAQVELQWSDPSILALNQAKEVLAKATLLSHPLQDAVTAFMTDASDVATGMIDGTQLHIIHTSSHLENISIVF